MRTNQLTRYSLKYTQGETIENILDWVKQFTRISSYNLWTAQQQANVLPLYLTKSALIFYNSLSNAVRSSAQQVLDALTKQFHSLDMQWTLRAKLYALKQTGDLTEFIDQLEQLSQQLNITDQVKLDLFLNGLSGPLKSALLLKQPKDFRSATNFARLKNATLQKDDKYDKILNKLEQMTEPRVPIANVQTQDMSVRVKQLETELHRLREQQPSQQQRYQNNQEYEHFNRQGSNRQNNNRITCFFCGKPGHFKRDCRQLEENRQSPYIYNRSYRAGEQYIADQSQPYHKPNFEQPQYMQNRTQQYQQSRNETEYTQDRNFMRRDKIPKVSNSNIVGALDLQENSREPIIDGYLNKNPITMLVDTGAAASLISTEFYMKMINRPKLINDKPRVKTADNTPMKVNGRVKAVYRIKWV